MKPFCAAAGQHLLKMPLTRVLTHSKAATEITSASTNYAKRCRINSRAAKTSTNYAKRRKIDDRAAATQSTTQNSSSEEITVKDLVDETVPSESYWKRLAEKRRVALDEARDENRRLHKCIEELRQKMESGAQMLQVARNIADVLAEMVYSEAETQIGGNGDTTPTGEDENSSESSLDAFKSGGDQSQNSI